MEIVAFDEGFPPLSSEAIDVTVNVKRNQEAPHITTEDFVRFEVENDASDDDRVTTIEAEDDDDEVRTGTNIFF